MLLKCHAKSRGTLLWRRYLVVMETSSDVTKTTSLQRLIMTSLYEMLKRRHFCNDVECFHRLQPYRNVRAASVSNVATTL